MLNPNWELYYKPNDFNEWRKIDAMGGSVYDIEIIENLLLKYYRNKNGGFLGDGLSHNQRRKILDKTMEELAEAVEYKKIQQTNKWNENQERDETLETKIQKDQDKRESSLKISSMYEILLGHIWIEPNGKVHPTENHFGFLMTHQNLWNEELRNYYDTKLKSIYAASKDFNFEHKLRMYFHGLGWVAVFNDSAKLFKKGLNTFLNYIKDTVPEEDWNARIHITLFDTSDFYYNEIGNFINGRAFKEAITASRKTVEYDATDDFVNYYKLMRKKKKRKKKTSSTLPNPWKKNYDYGEIPNFVDRLKWFNKKRKLRKEALFNILNNFIKK